MVDKPYSPDSLTINERPYQEFFEQLANEFSQEGYEIWVRSTDFQRSLAAGILKRETSVAAQIWLKYCSKDIQQPISNEVLNHVRTNLAADIECEFNKPS